MSTFSHSGNLGDIIWGLPIMMGDSNDRNELNLIPNNIPAVIRKYNNGPVFPEYENRLSQKDFDMIAPLLEVQPYINKLTFEPSREVDYDLDNFRGTVGQAFKKNFLETYAETFNTPVHSGPWLTVEPKKIAKCVISRTPRFHSGKTTTIPEWIRLLREHNVSNEGVFIGLPDEHIAFQEIFNIEIPYYKVNNFLEMAEVIAGAEKFFSNQTFSYSLAQGLGKSTFLEFRSIDCYVQKEGCYYF